MKPTDHPTPCEAQPVLILFSSDPLREAERKGLGKTAPETRAIYQVLLHHLLETLLTARQKVDFKIMVVSDESDAGNIREAFRRFPGSPGYTFVPHQGNTFSEKFYHALKHPFALGYQQVVMIGNDCPDLTPDLLAESFRQLSNHDTVLGPARDGGFYLLGLRRFDETLLHGIRWCSPAVLGQITANIYRLELSLYLLPPQRDIDARRDLHNWLCSAASSRAQVLLNTLQWIFLIRCFTCFYLPPFLEKTHARMRRWQMPPPDALQHS